MFETPADNVIITNSGLYVNPLYMREEDIDIKDIAKSLSQQCRWNGHCDRFYSVAEHSVHVASLCPFPHKLAALLHDATEAYLCDMPTPLKRQMPEYILAEDNLSKVIASKYGFEYPYHPQIKRADIVLLQIEAHLLTKHRLIEKPSLDLKLLCLNPKDAEELFLSTFLTIFNT